MLPKIEKITLADGRQAERHTREEDGKTITEVFAEEAKPLKLETRIVEKYKTALAEQLIETIKDGEVIEQKRLAVPEPEIKTVSHIATIPQEPSKYVTREQLGELVAQAVVSGINAQNQFKSQAVEPTAKQQLEAIIKKPKRYGFYIAVGIGVAIELVALVYILCQAA